MKKTILILFSTLLLSGCTGSPIKEVEQRIEIGISDIRRVAECILLFGCEPKAETYKPKAETYKPKAKTYKPKAKTYKPKAKTYKQRTGGSPWMMEVIENGQTIQISGVVNLVGGRKDEFNLVNDSGRKVCSGRFDFIEDGSKGDISISCFDGRINGDGEVFRTEYNKDLRMYSGAALIKTPTGEMRIIYGPNALKIK
jgi:hypothetical protein